jgi:NitT/TauT family transport system substrate-binding protein
MKGTIGPAWRAALAGAISLVAVSAAGAAEVIRVALPAPEQTEYAPALAAEDLGYFAAAGITAEFTAFRGAGAAQEAVAAGAADIVSIVAPGAAIAVAKGIQQKIVAGGPQVGVDGWRIIVLEDSPVKAPGDLAGKKVGISSKNSSTDFFAMWTARHFKVDFSAIPLGRAGPQALRARQIDAMVTSSTEGLRLITAGGFRTLVDFSTFPDMPFPEVWAASEDFIKRKPAVLRAFLDAIHKAALHMRANETYSRQFLKKHLDTKNDELVRLAHDIVIRTVTTDGRIGAKVIEGALREASFVGVSNLPTVEQLAVPDILIK